MLGKTNSTTSLGDIGKVLDEINGEDAGSGANPGDKPASYDFDSAVTSVSQLVVMKGQKWCYSWLIRFDNNQALPVEVAQDGTPKIDMSLLTTVGGKQNSDKLNGAAYIASKNTWVPCWGYDSADLLQYDSEEAKNIDSQDYFIARDMNWDEGHLGTNGLPSVHTSRFAFTIKDGVFTAADTYNNNAIVASCTYKTTTEAAS